ncbi:MAG TPA: hypothetical protein VGA89_00360 [Patescibacteria group bacterium]|jgi:hypothetical protein
MSEFFKKILFQHAENGSELQPLYVLKPAEKRWIDLVFLCETQLGPAFVIPLEDKVTNDNITVAIIDPSGIQIMLDKKIQTNSLGKLVNPHIFMRQYQGVIDILQQTYSEFLPKYLN